MSYDIVSIENSRGVYTAARPYRQSFGLTPNDASIMNVIVNVVSIVGGAATAAVTMQESYDAGVTWSNIAVTAASITAAGMFITSPNEARLISPLVRLTITPAASVALEIEFVKRTRIASGPVAPKNPITIPAGAATETTLQSINTSVDNIEAVAVVVGYGSAATAQRSAAMIGVNNAAVGAANPVHVAPGTGETFPVSASALPLPSGASTAAKQDEQTTKLTAIELSTDGINSSTASISNSSNTAATRLTNIDNKTPALGQALAASSTPVVLTAAQLTTLTPFVGGLTDTQLRATAVPVSVAGVATETTLAELNTKVTAVDTGAVVVASSALPTGAATETTLAALRTRSDIVDFGVTTAAQRVAAIVGNLSGVIQGSNPLQVDIGSNSYGTSVAASRKTYSTSGGLPVLATQSLMMGFDSVTNTHREANVDASGNLSVKDSAVFAARITSASVLPYIIDFVSTPLSTTYVQVVASTTLEINAIQVSHQGDLPVYISVGAAASEIVQYMILPGGDSPIVRLNIPAGSRIAIRAHTGTISANYLVINAFQ